MINCYIECSTLFHVSRPRGGGRLLAYTPGRASCPMAGPTRGRSRCRRRPRPGLPGAGPAEGRRPPAPPGARLPEPQSRVRAPGPLDPLAIRDPSPPQLAPESVVPHRRERRARPARERGSGHRDVGRPRDAPGPARRGELAHRPPVVGAGQPALVRGSPARHAARRSRFEDLPPIDVVLISHDHYDHLDAPTVQRLAATHRPALPGAARLQGVVRASSGSPTVDELDWWESRTHRGLTRDLHAGPALDARARLRDRTAGSGRLGGRSARTVASTSRATPATTPHLPGDRRAASAPSTWRPSPSAPTCRGPSCGSPTRPPRRRCDFAG